MLTLIEIMEKVKELYLSNPNVHLDVSITKPKKLLLKNTPATITGVYRHIFQVVESTEGIQRIHTLQYSDILTQQIKIYELDVVINIPSKKKNL